MKTLQDLYAENPQDYMALAAEGNKSRKILAVNENDELVLLKQPVIELTYAEKRSLAYPSVADQLDMLYWDAVRGTHLWQEAIAAVKARYPKPESVEAVEQETED